jgi:hypothetical protein
MSKYIGIIFPNEAMLTDLHAEGSIALSRMAVVVKDTTGTLSVKKSVDEARGNTKPHLTDLIL